MQTANVKTYATPPTVEGGRNTNAITLGDLVSPHILEGTVAVYRYESWEGYPELLCDTSRLPEDVLVKPLRGITYFGPSWVNGIVEVAIGEWEGTGSSH